MTSNRWLTPAFAARAYAFVALQLLSVVVMLGVLELGIRLFADPIPELQFGGNALVTDPGQAPVFKVHPFAAFTWLPNARFLLQTVNSHGFVSTREIPFERRPNELRIVALGGSSTVGNGNIDEETYPRRLERALQARFPGRVVNVINAAAGGYSTAESLGYLRSRIVHWRPDIAIIMHAWNDMYYFTLDDQALSEWRTDFNEQVLTNAAVGKTVSQHIPFDVRYLAWSQLYLHTREWLRKAGLNGHTAAVTIEHQFDNATMNPNGTVSVKLKSVNSRALELYERNLRAIHQTCVDFNIACYTILQPSLFARGADMHNAAIVEAAAMGALYHGLDYKTHYELFSRMYECNRSVFGDEYTIDATGMNGRPELFLDHIHLNAAGTSQLAGIVLERLVASGRLGP